MHSCKNKKENIPNTGDYIQKYNETRMSDSILYSNFGYSTNSPYVDCFTTPQISYIDEEDKDDRPTTYNVFDIGYPFITVGDFYIVKFDEFSSIDFSCTNDTISSILGEIKIKVNSKLPREGVYLLIVVSQKYCDSQSSKFVLDRYLILDEIFRFYPNDVITNTDYIINKINTICKWKQN